MPSLKRITFDGQMLECVFNLKSQGIAYTIYCEDNNNLYPGVNNAGQARRSIYDYGHGLGAALRPYFPNGDSMVSNPFSRVEPTFKCRIGFEYQSHPTYYDNKAYYGLFFNASDPFATNNNSRIRTDLKHPSRMRSLGDTWTWSLVWSNSSWYGIRDQKFNLLAMEGSKFVRGGGSAGIYSNHFWDGFDLIPSTQWYGGFSPHRSRFGEAVINFLFDDGSTNTERVFHEEINIRGKNGWNVRNPSGAGSDTWMAPRRYAVGN